MIKALPAILLCAIAVCIKAQTTSVKVSAQFKEVQPYGQVDIEDLEMKACDFEPDANAEVLFDVGNLTPTSFERHVRIKIFNEFGKNEGSVRLEDYALDHRSEIKGETFNLVNGKVEVTQLDSKSIFRIKEDKFRAYVAFALPNIKAGSVIEFIVKVPFSGVWAFQSNLPTRYSEIKTDFPGGRRFKFIPHVRQAFVKNVGLPTDFVQIKALANVRSLSDEVFMTSRETNLQRIEFVGIVNNYGTWPDIGQLLLTLFNRDEYIDSHIKGESDIIARAKKLKSMDERVAFIFDTVKNNLSWNKRIGIFPEKDAARTWDDKAGSVAEINWIVYHLLKKTGIKAYPLIVSIKEFGKLNPIIPDLNKLINMVVYLPVDSTKSYVLDESNKYNLFNKAPTEELNTFGLDIDEDSKLFQTVFIEHEEPAIQSVFINAEILPEGKLKGNTEINSYSYHKINALTKYHQDGEEKYLRYLSNNDNSVKISGLKLEGANVDSIPLTQKFNFDVDLTGSDEHYIYFNANLFTLMGENPFKKEERFSDIDFGYRDNYAINGLYKIPAGFKADSLPKSVTIVMPDTSIIFKRIVAENEGTILVKYSLNHKKTIYFKEDYQDVRGFYKKMYDLISEQLILKKE